MGRRGTMHGFAARSAGNAPDYSLLVTVMDGRLAAGMQSAREKAASGGVALGWQRIPGLRRPRTAESYGVRRREERTQMPDPQREPEEHEPNELGEEELGGEADAWEEEDLEGLDEESPDLNARAERIA